MKAALTGLALAALALALYNGLGAWDGWARQAFLRRLPLAAPWQYLLVSRAVWAAIWAAVGLGLWRKSRWAWRAAWPAFGAYVLLAGLERFLLARSAYAASTRGFTLGVLALSLALGYGLLLWSAGRRKKVRNLG